MPAYLKKIKHVLEYVGVRFLAFLAGQLPLMQARILGRGLGRMTFAIIRIRRRVTLDNLTQAFPEKSPDQIKRLARSTYEQFGMMMMETLKLLTLNPEQLKQQIHIDDPSPFKEALKKGCGAILLTGHLGNWEYLGAWISVNGYPATYLFQEQANPLVSEFIRRYRMRMGMDVVPRGMALRGYMRALRNGRFVAVVADQDAGRNGIFVRFMGQMAATATGPARFALKTGAPIIFGVSYRDSQHNLHAHIEFLQPHFDPEDEKNAIRLIVEAYTRKLEQWIRCYPDQWFWMHRRWKTKPMEKEIY